jgi:hypothetical protein
MADPSAHGIIEYSSASEYDSDLGVPDLVAPERDPREREALETPEASEEPKPKKHGGSRVWVTPHWRVSWPEKDASGAEIIVTKEYPTIAALAKEKGLSANTLRHIRCNTKTGKSIRSEKYRGLKIVKIKKTPGPPSRADVGDGCEWAEGLFEAE